VPPLPPKPPLRDDPILGHFHLVHTEEEKLHWVLRRILGDLADDSTHGVGNRGVEDDLAHPHAGKIHSHLMTVM